MNQNLMDLVKEYIETRSEESFSKLYAETFPHVQQGLHYMLKDYQLAEDLAQDTMISVHEKIGQLEQPEAYMAWVNTISNNLAKTHIRKASSGEIVFSGMATESENGSVSSVEDTLETDRAYELPEEAMDQKETARIVREIIDDLPGGQRAAVTMHYYQDMKIRDIASVLGSNENAVKQSLHQAKKKISDKVAALEKQGVKLHGLSPFAFFLWLFVQGGASSAGAAGAAAAGAAAIGTAGAAAASTAGAAGAAGSATAGMAATGGFFAWIGALPAAVKAAIAVGIGAAVIGGGAAVITGMNQKNSTPESGKELVTLSSETEEEVVESTGESLTEIEEETAESTEKTEEETEEETTEETEEESTKAAGSEPAETEAPTTAAPTTAAPEPTEATTVEETEPETTEAPTPDYIYKNEYFSFTLPESWRGKVTGQAFEDEDGYGGYQRKGFTFSYNGHTILTVAFPQYSLEGGEGVDIWVPVDPSKYLYVDLFAVAWGHMCEIGTMADFFWSYYPGYYEGFETSDEMRELIYLQTGEYMDPNEIYGRITAMEADTQYVIRDQKTAPYFNNVLANCVEVYVTP